MATNRSQVKAKPVDEQIRRSDIYLQALEDDDRLTDWEKGFCASISEWFYTQDRKLTPEQYNTLERIYRHLY